jgi:hypothetical protein
MSPPPPPPSVEQLVVMNVFLQETNDTASTVPGAVFPGLFPLPPLISFLLLTFMEIQKQHINLLLLTALLLLLLQDHGFPCNRSWEKVVDLPTSVPSP